MTRREEVDARVVELVARIAADPEGKRPEAAAECEELSGYAAERAIEVFTTDPATVQKLIDGCRFSMHEDPDDPNFMMVEARLGTIMPGRCVRFESLGEDAARRFAEFCMSFVVTGGRANDMLTMGAQAADS